MKVCPKCKSLMSFNTYFCAFICSECEHMIYHRRGEEMINGQGYIIDMLDIHIGKQLNLKQTIEKNCHDLQHSFNEELLSVGDRISKLRKMKSILEKDPELLT